MTVPSSPRNGSVVVRLTQLIDLTEVLQYSARVAVPEVDPVAFLLVDLVTNRRVTPWIVPS
jgi:hypothetical protein